MPNLVETIKKAAVEAVEARKPTAFLFGTVKSTDPIKIAVDQKMVLGEKQLILSSLVSDIEVPIVMDHQTEETSGGSDEASFESHGHDIKGVKNCTLNLGLKQGEKVVLIRMQGGQQFYVLDRVR